MFCGYQLNMFDNLSFILYALGVIDEKNPEKFSDYFYAIWS